MDNNDIITFNKIVEIKKTFHNEIYFTQYQKLNEELKTLDNKRKDIKKQITIAIEHLKQN